jgi:hypothetical protein
VRIVYLALDIPRLSADPWVQVDDPRVPFARLFEPANWSAALGSPGRTLIGCECYCQAVEADTVWTRSDEDLAADCAAALAWPLGMLSDAGAARLVDAIRLPRAYPSVPVAAVAAARAPVDWLGGIVGVEIAQGGAVIEAIEAGEAAAERVLGTER